jgi:hypothetical protein
MHGVAGWLGDFDLFVDADGTAYQTRTGLVIEKLTPDFLAGTGELVTVEQPFVEAPVLTRRGQSYYLLAGYECCACRGGANELVWTAPAPLGPYRMQGDIGAEPNESGLRSDPTNFVTRAQASAVFRVGGAYVWLGNQWVTGPARDRDLLYWDVLQFDGAGKILQMTRREQVQITLPSP